MYIDVWTPFLETAQTQLRNSGTLLKNKNNETRLISLVPIPLKIIKNVKIEMKLKRLKIHVLPYHLLMTCISGATS